MKRDLWNRCDVCGKFIPFDDFPDTATRMLVTPDSEFSREEWETLCKEHIARSAVARFKARLEA